MYVNNFDRFPTMNSTLALCLLGLTLLVVTQGTNSAAVAKGAVCTSGDTCAANTACATFKGNKYCMPTACAK